MKTDKINCKIYRTLLITIFMSLLGLINQANAQAGTSQKSPAWQECTPLPEKMSPACEVINKKIYAVKRVDDFKSPGYVCEYDPVTNTWQRKADMPVIKSSFQSFVLKNKLYIIGGISDSTRKGSATLEEYDPANGRWTKKASMKTGRDGIGIMVYKDKVYAMGGITAGGIETNSVEMYDPNNDSWETKAEMPTNKSWSNVCCINDRFYLFGNNVEEYDPAKNSWTLKAPVPRQGEGACRGMVLNGSIFALFSGGQNPHAKKYDPVTDTWTTLASPLGNSYDYDLTSWNNSIFVLGGFYKDVKNVLEAVYRYDITQNKWERLPDLLFGRLAAGVVTIDSTMYVIGGQFGWYGPVRPIHYADAVEKLDLVNTFEINAILGDNKIIESPTFINFNGKEINAKFSETPSWLKPYFKNIDNKQHVVNRINIKGLKKGIHKAKVKIISEDISDNENNYYVVLTVHEPGPAQDVQNLKKGLKYEYYEENSFTTLPDFKKMKPKKTGITENINLSIKDRDTLFAAVYSGYIKIPETAVYTFSLASDDGSKLYLDDKLYINNDGLHGTIEKSENCCLEKGFHKIKVEYMQSMQGYGLGLSYEAAEAGIKKKAFSENELFY